MQLQSSTNWLLALTNATLFWRQGMDLDQIVEQNSKYAGLVWREWSLVEICLPLNYRSWISKYIAQPFPPLDITRAGSLRG